MHSTGLSCQDTLPAEDPSWSYSRVPGQPAPIPPRNEPMLYIPNNTMDNSNLHATALCFKNLHLKVHLPSPPANSESTNDDGTVTLMTHASNMTNADHHLGKVCIIKSTLVSTCWLWCPKSKDFVARPLAKPLFGLDDEALPLSAMTALTIHTSRTSGIYLKYSGSKKLMITF